jgi:hypothetical protein
MKSSVVPLRRFLSVLLLALLPILATAAEGPLAIEHVYTGWRDAASFKRISEYFNGQENTHGEAILRTHPDQRGGFYFLVRVNNPGPARTIKVSLHVITSANARTSDYQFATGLKADGDTVFQLGLTGADWTDPKGHPVAWKLDLLDADGKTLATEGSYLWEKPATK